jgi:hypothetical protein
MMAETKHELAKDESLKNSGDSLRTSREASDVQRQDEDGTVYRRSERRQLDVSEWSQTALPNPPPIPGYHLCWLSTTNSYDPIHKRIRLGYEPVSLAECPDDFASFSMKSGEWKGFIAVNEMLLFKIPDEKYQDIMAEIHYHRPLDEEQSIRATVQNNTSVQDNNGKTLGSIEGDGFGTIGSGSRTRVPIFK